VRGDDANHFATGNLRLAMFGDGLLNDPPEARFVEVWRQVEPKNEVGKEEKTPRFVFGNCTKQIALDKS
jgi:hypothetical protein